ncbi:MAG: hypothetical protein ACE5FU_11560 [Nitrospinota bacterium]
MNTILIGIDPGKKTGVAVRKGLNSNNFLDIKTMPIHFAMNLVQRYRCNAVSLTPPSDKNKLNILVIVEDARQRRWFGNAGKEKLMGAGSIKRDCTIWEDFLKDMDIPHKMVKPSKGKTKISSNYFNLITGWQGRTSEHARDAAMLIHGINAQNIKAYTNEIKQPT